MPAEGSLLVVRVFAGGSVIVQSALVELRDQARSQVGDWRGVLYVPIDAFKMGDAGDLELQLSDGRKYRFVIVGSAFASQVNIRGFGPSPVGPG